ncbi:MAG: hypothetical protein ACK41D_09840 [Rubricoccaceae bacterium]
MRLLRPLLFLALLSLSAPLLAPGAQAQQARLIPLGDPVYDTLGRLHRHGLLLELHPTALPYTEGEVREALARLDSARATPRALGWAEQVRRRVGPAPAGAPGRQRAGLELAGGTRLATSDRLDPVRFSDAGEPSLQAGAVRVYPQAWLQAWIAEGPLVAQFGLRHDVAYNDDPDGLDLVNRLMVRNEEAYVGASGRGGAVFLGRLAQHWAPPSADAVLLSRHPRPFDGVRYRIGGGRFAIRGLVGELDSVTEDGRFTGRVGDNDVQEGAISRLLALHRIDWRPRRNIVVSGQEGAVLSGPVAGFSFPYLLPTLVYAFSIDNTPKNVENNGLVGGQLWMQFGPVTVQGQLLIDDIDLMNAAEQASLALAGTLEAARVLPDVDAGFALTLATARTYNTDQPAGRYVYALRGIGLPETDYVHARLYADTYLDALAPGLVVTPELQVLWQGEADLRGEQVPFEGTPLILTGTPEHTLRAGARLYLAPTPHWWLRVDAGLNATRNAGFAPGAHATRFVALVEAGARLRIGGSIPTGW